jgi:hypothetical protein
MMPDGLLRSGECSASAIPRNNTPNEWSPSASSHRQPVTAWTLNRHLEAIFDCWITRALRRDLPRSVKVLACLSLNSCRLLSFATTFQLDNLLAAFRLVDGNDGVFFAYALCLDWELLLLVVSGRWRVITPLPLRRRPQFFR